MPLTCANLGSNIGLRFPLRFDALDDFLPVRMHGRIYRTGGNLCQRLSDINLNHNGDMLNTFGERVRAARKLLKLSQAALGKKAGLSQTTISDIERGRNDTTNDLLPLAAALQCSPGYLLYGTDDSAEKLQPSILTPGQKELLEIWALLLPTEQEAVLEKIRERAKHNQEVLSKLVPPTLQDGVRARTIVVSDRRKSNIPFHHAGRREEDGKG